MAGAFLPSFASSITAPPGTVGMAHEDFTTTQIEIKVGENVTMVNDSGYLHVIGPGRDGVVYQQDGNPLKDRFLSERNGIFETGPFEQPGVYWITCRTHPMMNLRVTVVE